MSADLEATREAYQRLRREVKIAEAELYHRIQRIRADCRQRETDACNDFERAVGTLRREIDALGKTLIDYAALQPMAPVLVPTDKRPT